MESNIPLDPSDRLKVQNRMQKQSLVIALSHIKLTFTYSTSQVVTVNCHILGQSDNCGPKKFQEVEKSFW